MDGYALAYCCWSFNLIVWPSRRGGLINESTFFPESLPVPRQFSVPPSVLSNRLSFFSRLCFETYSASIRSTSSLSLYVSVCMCVSAVMCSPVRPLKIPLGRGDPGAKLQVARPSRRDVPLSLFHVFCRTFSFLSCSCVFPLIVLTVSALPHISACNSPLTSPILLCPLQGERCSFSVQMWFYFLCGLRSDLWAVLPADFAKETLGQVLSETLQLLVQRYNSVRPSYKRQLQVRCNSCASKLDLFQCFFFQYCYTQSCVPVFPLNSCLIQHLKIV